MKPHLVVEVECMQIRGMDASRIRNLRNGAYARLPKCKNSGEGGVSFAPVKSLITARFFLTRLFNSGDFSISLKM